MTRSTWRTVVLGSVLVAFGCGGIGNNGPLPKVSPAESSKPDDKGLVTQIRPLVARISDSDPLQIVLHWESDKGPLTRLTAVSVNWVETCNSLVVHVTAPDGQKRQLKPIAQKKSPHTGELFSAPTLFIKLQPQGVAVTPHQYQSDWQGGPVPLLESKGTFRLSVSGELLPGTPKQGKPIPFTSPTVEIERGVAGYKSLDEIASIATAQVRSKLKAGTDMGGQVYDDAEGNRLVHLTGPISQQWQFTIYTVQVSPTGKVLGVFSREVSNCLAEGTQVQGEHDSIAIEDVQAGNRLWGYDLERGVRVLTTVRSVRRGLANETVRFGCGLRVTGDHPLYASGRWMEAGHLSESDRLLTPSGATIPVGKIERILGTVAVFDVTVDEPHNFFAGGVLVHNKSRDYWPHLDDLWYRLWSPKEK